MNNKPFISRVLRTTVPSYLKIFFPNEKDIVLVYNKHASTSEFKIELKPQIKARSHNDSDSADLDLTGDPLKVDLGGDETFTSVKSEEHPENWTIEESKHCPLSLEAARQVINSHLRIKKKLEADELSLPIFAVCDGRDELHTVLLGAHTDGNFIMTAAVYVLDLGKINQGPLTLENMQSDHKKYLRNPNVEIKYKVQMRYQLFGTNLQHLAYLNKHTHYNGSISLVVTTNKCEFEVPRENSNISMKLQVIAGHPSSKIYSFWKEVCLLQSYLEIMRDNELCQNEATPLCSDPVEETTIFKSIVELMSTNSLKREVKKAFDISNLRDDTFLDKLWRILQNCENIGILRDSFHCLFEELASAGTHILVQDDGSYISTLISGILNGKVIISSITFAQALELLFELGAEKLRHDYVAIIKHVNSTKLQVISAFWDSFRDKERSLQDARRTRITQNLKSSGLKLEQHSNKLSYLGHLHVTAEFIFLVKHSINLSESSFDYFCEGVVKTHVESFKKLMNFWDLRNRPLCDFECKLNWGDVNVIEGRDPVQWTLRMTSNLNGLEVTTVYDLSKSRVFPPVVYDDFDILESVDDDMVYYVSKMVKHKEHCETVIPAYL